MKWSINHIFYIKWICTDLLLARWAFFGITILKLKIIRVNSVIARVSMIQYLLYMYLNVLFSAVIILYYHWLPYPSVYNRSSIQPIHIIGVRYSINKNVLLSNSYNFWSFMKHFAQIFTGAWSQVELLHLKAQLSPTKISLQESKFNPTLDWFRKHLATLIGQSHYLIIHR